MTDTTTTSPEIGGIGHSVKRAEDARLIEGQGNFVDDIALPGMLYMALVRSPVAHARINSIDTEAAAAVDGVVAVVTGELMDAHGLAWMPTLSGDTQAVLATDKVRYQGQEVAAVVATDPYIATDAAELVDVDYEMLDAITTPQQSLAHGAELIRDEKEGQTDNLAYTWETGDAAATEAAFANADRVVSLTTHYPRSHPSPLETCGIVADVNSVTGQATLYMTSQAPHAHRTLFALVAGLPEQNIRIVSPDIGGGFGNKVPIYPGYVVATAASLLIGKPVKWVETRTGNLISTGFGRDYYMTGELALSNDGRIQAMRVDMLSDQGAFYADAQPSRYKAGLFHVCTGSYDFGNAHIKCRGAFTNKAPGGVAYRCSFRITEASFLIERLMQTAADELGIDPAELRMRNFIQPEQFPYETPTGFVYDSGDYPTALRKALDAAGYDELRAEQAASREQGKLMGIGIAHFTEAVGAGPAHTYDIAGLKMIDSAELRVHPTGKAVLKIGVKTQGQGHETTFAQIVAEETGIPASDIKVIYGDTDDDAAFAAYTNLPEGMEYGLEDVTYYNPPNLTFPYGSYVVVVDVDPDTGVWKVRRMIALDDCGVRINPMIVEGQIHGGLTEGFAMSSMQWITFDDDGNCIGSNFMDYLIPTAWETPRFELLETVTPSPHHPIGAKGIGESATVGSPAAFVNAVVDAVAHLGVRNIDMPVLPDRVWEAIETANT